MLLFVSTLPQSAYFTTSIEVKLVLIIYIDLLSQISYSLVVILKLSGVSEVQYKEIIIIGDK